MRSRGTLTLAFGRPRYIERAKALARSLILHDPTVMRAIITDSKDPELGDLFTYRIHYRPEYGTSLRQKMYLDRYTPFEETLFLDSDSLAVRPLDAFWRAFQSLPFGVCGVPPLCAGNSDDSLDVDFLLHRFHLTTLPKLNGALYYFKRSPEAAAFFSTARNLLLRATELHFTNLHRNNSNDLPSDDPRDNPSDEALYSVAMAIHGLTITDMGLGGMANLLDRTGSLTLDIPNGLCAFHQRGRALTPDILHVGPFTESLFYLRECSRLEHLARGSSALTRSEELQLNSTASILWTHRKARNLRQRLQQLFTFAGPSLPTSSTSRKRHRSTEAALAKAH